MDYHYQKRDGIWTYYIVEAWAKAINYKIIQRETDDTQNSYCDLKQCYWSKLYNRLLNVQFVILLYLFIFK